MVSPVRPSETQSFQRCPMYWYRKHVEDWQAPDEAWTPWQLMGSAVHAGLAMYWKERLRKQAFGVPSNAVIDMFTHGWPQNAPPEFSHDGLESLALKVLDAVLKWIAKNMPDAEPVMVEHPLGPDGHTTPDLVTREAGQLVVTDWKTSWNLDADRMRYRLEGIERDHQFLHYSWAVSEHLREPVTLFRKVVIVGSPRIIVRDAVFRPDPRAIEYWLRSARQMWESMDRMRRGDEVAWLNPNGCFQYGVKYPCPYLDACWTCHGDAEQMKNFLVRTPGGAG